jgi:hypothetical protein
VAAAEGVTVMVACLVTPMLRDRRRTWGLPSSERARTFPGDELVADPSWEWAHAVEIGAAAGAVWPWVAQIGADRAGFYSYEVLENLVGCRVRNAEHVDPSWRYEVGDALSIHPKAPPMPIVALEPGRWFVAHAGPPHDGPPTAPGDVAVSWAFIVEPLGPQRSRLFSRYRCATAPDRATRLQFGPTFVEPISFAMDRAMLRGVRERAER